MSHLAELVDKHPDRIVARGRGEPTGFVEKDNFPAVMWYIMWQSQPCRASLRASYPAHSYRPGWTMIFVSPLALALMEFEVTAVLRPLPSLAAALLAFC